VTKVPLGVQVYAQGATSPAIDVAFTSIRFAQPPDRNFRFTPPPGAQVRNGGTGPSASAAPSAPRTTPVRHGLRVSGSGWTRVVSVDADASTLGTLTSGPLANSLSPVSGAWGTGRLLDAALISVLAMSDGRIIAGAVEPAQLYAAAGQK
jgi:hypothetical protein